MYAHAYYITRNVKILEVITKNGDTIWVYDNNEKRCISLENPQNLASHTQETCISRENPKVANFEYFKMVLGALYIQPKPQKILLIGLGGGGLVLMLKAILPNASIDAVEINPEMVYVAKKYFTFREDDHIKLHLMDGLDYVKQVSLDNNKYDYIIVDAFSKDYIPPQFLTIKFAQMLKNILSQDGVIAMNTFYDSKYRSLESSMFYTVFGEFYNLTIPHGNRVIIASNQVTKMEKIQKNAKFLESKFTQVEINTTDLVAKFHLCNTEEPSC